MSRSKSNHPLSDDEAWFVAQRWQQYDGEYRANYMRILSVALFYLVHVLQHYRPFGLFESPHEANQTFHLAATMIAAGWLLMSLAIDVCLKNQIFPQRMPIITTGLDLALLTATLCLGGGQKSPLVLGYCLILILAALRINLPLIRLATGGALLGYLFLLFMGKWPQLFGDRVIGIVPRYAQVMTLLAIVMSGIMLGQLIRRLHGIARYYAYRRGVGDE